MLETADFFETQIKQCRDSAAQSSKKNDREFWLKMANRWEGLLQARRGDIRKIQIPTSAIRETAARSLAPGRFPARTG